MWMVAMQWAMRVICARVIKTWAPIIIIVAVALTWVRSVIPFAATWANNRNRLGVGEIQVDRPRVVTRVTNNRNRLGVGGIQVDRLPAVTRAMHYRNRLGIGGIQVDSPWTVAWACMAAWLVTLAGCCRHTVLGR